MHVLRCERVLARNSLSLRDRRGNKQKAKSRPSATHTRRMQDAGSEPPQGLQKRRESPRYSDGAVDADAVGDAAVLDAEVKAMVKVGEDGGEGICKAPIRWR